MTETLVRMGAPAVTLGTLSPVTVQRNLKAALVSFVSMRHSMIKYIRPIVFISVRFSSA